MRAFLGALLVVVTACTGADDGNVDPAAPRSYDFGPFQLGAGEEVTKNCVQISLNNDDYIYINAVELTTGPGFHHSNWFYVPSHVFEGEDGVFTCDDRNFNEPAAAIFGGVLFAQST